MEDMFYEENIQEEEEGFDVGKYIHILLKRKWIITGIFLIITIPWVLYLKKLPPSYEAFCDIEFRSLENEQANVISESRIIKLRSRTFAENVVAKLGLTLRIDAKEEGLDRHQLFSKFTTTKSPRTGDYVLRQKDGSSFTIHWKYDGGEKLITSGIISDAKGSLQSTDAGFNFQINPNLSDKNEEIHFNIAIFKYAVQAFRQRTNVGFRGPNILRLSMSDRDPVLVAQMVNQLAQIYVDESKSLKRASVEERKKIIIDQLSIAEAELDEIEQQLKDFKSRHVVSLDAETENRSRELSEAESELVSLNAQLGDLDEVMGKLGSSLDKEQVKYVYRQLAELPTFTTNYKMNAMKNQLIDLEAEYGSIITEKHPRAVELRGAIADLQNQIEQEAKSHRGELRGRIQSTQSRISSIRYNLKQKLPEDQAQLMALERERRSREDIYRELKTKSQTAAIQEAVDTESVDILDPAIVPDYPVNRDKKKKAVMGAFFAFALGLGVAFGLEFLDKSIKTVDDVKRYLKLQVLGTIPNIDFQDIGDYQDSEKLKQIDQQLVTYDYSPTPIGEAYRSLRTNLVFSKSAGRIQSFVITSTSPGDGKSFTAANLAISMAQHKSNTILIDADLRRGVLHNTFGVPKEPGFTNYLTGMSTFAHIINETLIPNLFIISCGSLLPNPSELLGSPQMKRFLDEAKRKFDYIIFDSPPLTAATDAIVIGTQVDAVVDVVRSGVTNRNTARQKLELFKNVPARVIGVILNGTTSEFGHDGYSYYHY